MNVRSVTISLCCLAWFTTEAAFAADITKATVAVPVFVRETVEVAQVIHDPPVRISFGKIDDPTAVEDKELRQCLLAQYFPASWPEITYAQWRALFAKDAFKSEEAARISYDTARTKFPTPESYTSHKTFSKLGNRYLTQELYISVEEVDYCILVMAFDRANLDRVGFKLFSNGEGVWKSVSGIPSKLQKINFPWNVSKKEFLDWKSGCAVALQSGRLVFFAKPLDDVLMESKK